MIIYAKCVYIQRIDTIAAKDPWRSSTAMVLTLFSRNNPAFMMTSSNGNIFRVTGHLCGEFTGPRWFPRKASDAELWCFLWSACVWINDWVNNREAGDLRRYRAHYDVIAMLAPDGLTNNCCAINICFHLLIAPSWSRRVNFIWKPHRHISYLSAVMDCIYNGYLMQPLSQQIYHRTFSGIFVQIYLTVRCWRDNITIYHTFWSKII